MAAGIDNLSGKFLKNGAEILARLIPQLFNLSIKLIRFLEVVKLQESNHFLKKPPKLTLKMQPHLTTRHLIKNY